MAASDVPSLLARLADLERQVRELKARLQALETREQSPAEHPTDRKAVREKAVYDWQGPH